MEDRLILKEVSVGQVSLADSSRLVGDTLTVKPDELEDAAMVSSPIVGLRIGIAHPGERARINRVLDVLEPRYKEGGGGEVFPGISTEELECGSGVTVALDGIAVVATGTLPTSGRAFEQEDCVIDMSPPPSALCPFSTTNNVVLSFELRDDCDRGNAERAIRESSVRVARWLASLVPSSLGEIAAGAEGDRTNMAGKRSSAMHRIAYICHPHSGIAGACDSYLRGKSTVYLEPTWISADELSDGAVVSGDFHYACSRVPTFLYQRNPIVRAIHQWSNRADLVGVLLSIPQPHDEAKRSNARRVVSMLIENDIHGLIVHPAAGGNLQLDAMYVIQEAEHVGIRTSMILQEMAGPRGADPGMVGWVPDANLLISTGNRDEIVWLKQADTVYGGVLTLKGRRIDEEGSISLRDICASTTQVGEMTRGCVTA
jgi:hypothetical protein